MTKKTGLTYAGKGAFLQGIPARDLTPEEVSKLSPELKKKALKSGLYEETLQEQEEVEALPEMQEKEQVKDE